MSETPSDETQADHRSTAESLREYGRGFAGGLLISIPLLYTMEIWWTGFLATPERLLVLLAFTFFLLLGYNRYAGLRHDASWIEVAIDSVEELGLGLVTSAIVLYLIGRIGSSVSRQEALGMIVVEAAVAAVGFSVGSAQLGSGGPETGKGSKESGQRGLGNHIFIAACGAVLFAANVAPTEEIVIIAMETGAGPLIGLAVLSLAVGAGVLYYMDFKAADQLAHAESTLDVVTGAVSTYAVALAASAAILWFFGRFDHASAALCAREVIVLGFPAALGAAAGRLLIQS
jgi:putative integral membrane protein (TIGR02587 family)